MWASRATLPEVLVFSFVVVEDGKVVGLPLERLMWWVDWGMGAHIAHAVVEAEEEAFHEDAGC